MADGFTHNQVMVKLIPSSEDVRVYEIALMYQPDLDQKAEKTLLSNVEGMFSEAKAKLLFKDPWTKRGLAYKIGGFSEAKFVIYYYEADPSTIRELDNSMRLEKGVLRHLILMPPKGYEAVSFEDRYQDWLKNRETVAEVRARKKEEKLKQTVATQAKRKTERLAAKPKEVAKPMEKEKLDATLDKLISDEDLKF